MGTRKRSQARRRVPPSIRHDRSYGVMTEEGRIFERERKSQEHRTDAQLAAARKRIHDESERLRRKFDRGGEGPPF